MPSVRDRKLLKPIHNNPHLLYVEVMKAAADVQKQGGMQIEWRFEQ